MKLRTVALLLTTLLSLVLSAIACDSNNETGPSPNNNTEDIVKMRKQVYELTISDFEQFPVWEFALDEEGVEGQDEATVRPYQFNPPLDPGDGLMVAKAAFTLADNTKMNGYIYPPFPDDATMGFIQPVIIVGQQQVMFWYGIMEPDQDILSQNYQLLGKDANEIFPLKFRSVVELKYGVVEGTIDGFMHKSIGFDTIQITK